MLGRDSSRHDSFLEVPCILVRPCMQRTKNDAILTAGYPSNVLACTLLCRVHFYYSPNVSIDGGVWTICGATPTPSRGTRRCHGGRCCWFSLRHEVVEVRKGNLTRFDDPISRARRAWNGGGNVSSLSSCGFRLVCQFLFRYQPQI